MGALSHVKTNAVADFTGTVTVFNSAGSTATANATDLIRPGDWNSVHNFFNTISGNTLGSSTATGTNMVYGATGGVSLSHSTAASLATMWISAPGTSSLSATGAVSISVNANTISIGVPATSLLSATGQLSISSNGATISIGAPADVTLQRYMEFKEAPVVAGQHGQGTLHVQPWVMPNVQYDRMCFEVFYSNASNSTGSQTISMWFGVYTKNVSTLSLASSTSISYAVTGSGTVGNASLQAGARNMTLGSTNTITAGQYWLGVVSRTTSAGGNATFSQFLASQINSVHSGIFGQASNASAQWLPGFGVFSASTAGMPASIAFSNIRGTDSLALRPPSLFFISGTV